MTQAKIGIYENRNASVQQMYMRSGLEERRSQPQQIPSCSASENPEALSRALRSSHAHIPRARVGAWVSPAARLHRGETPCPPSRFRE